MTSSALRGFVVVGLLAIAPAVEAAEIYVPNFTDLNVSVLDATTLASLGSIPVEGGNPAGVALSKDRKFAFVTLADSDQVAVINTASRTVVKYITVFPMTHDSLISMRPQGDRMYVTSCGDPFVEVIDVATQTSIGQIALADGSYPLVFSPDGLRGYAGTGYDVCSSSEPAEGLYVLDLDDSSPTVHTQIGFIETSQEVWDAAVSRDGTYALATGINPITGGSRILVIDLGAGAETGAAMCGAVECEYSGTAGITFNGAGTRAYVVDSGTNELIVVDTDSRSATYLQQLSIVPILLTTADAAWQINVSNGCAHIVAFHSDGTTASELVNFAISVDEPVQVRAGLAGAFAYELDVAGRGRCPLPDDGNARGRKVHGAGRVMTADKVTFEFQAKQAKKGPTGKCRVVDHAEPKELVRCLSVTSLTVVGNVATITGTALHNGVSTSYEITAVDNGRPGKNADMFSITTGSGFATGDVLRSGNVTIK